MKSPPTLAPYSASSITSRGEGPAPRSSTGLRLSTISVATRSSSFRSCRESIVYSAASTAAIETASQSATRKSISFSRALKSTRSSSPKGVRQAPMMPLTGSFSGMGLVEKLGDDARMAGVAALHPQRQRHDAGLLAHDASNVHNVLGDEHAVAKQRLVHGKIEAFRGSEEHTAEL